MYFFGFDTYICEQTISLVINIDKIMIYCYATNARESNLTNMPKPKQISGKYSISKNRILNIRA